MTWKIQDKRIPRTPDELIVILLKNRGITKKDEHAFLNPPHPEDFTPKDVGIDPKSMKQAVKRIMEAKKKKERVVVFGDYDADGIGATAILWEALYAEGIDAVPFIPHREKHGYGVSDKALDGILKHRVDLLITVDNGIVAHGPFKRLKEHGVDTILTDHHLKEKKLPPADIIVHTTDLCGATVAWMLAKEVNSTAALKSLDLAAVATIADQVPLLGANRSFAQHGLDALRKTKRPGLLRLMELAGIEKEMIDTYTVNFAIAPRLNAMGRIKHAMDALRLVCTRSKEKALLLAEGTQETNQQRQDITWASVNAALARKDEWKEEFIIIVSGEDFHDGVIGLVAGKLMEEFWKPAIVINITGDASKASARSVPGVNIIDLIRKAKHHLIEAGGHPMAAGFSLETKNIEAFKKEMEKIAKEMINPELLKKSMEVECVVPPELVTLETAGALHVMEPFGIANPKPVVGIRDLTVEDVFTMGQDGKHLKILLKGNGTEIKGVGFNMGRLAGEIHRGQQVDVAGYVQENRWRGKVEMQVVVKAVTSMDVLSFSSR